MSKPCEISKKNPVGSVAGEIMSAMSSLNMEPDPITPKPGKELYYLSELDAWAKHSMEHMRQAMAGTRVALEYINRLQLENDRLRYELAKLNETKRKGD